jgi:hypothetical protein
MSTKAAAVDSTTTTSNTVAGEYLLERLRILLNRLQSTSDTLQNWPESGGDSSKVHQDAATELIASIRKIVLGVRSVERHVNGTGPSSSEGTKTDQGTIPKEALEAFRASLDDKCPIPLDLLDLMDVGHPFGMNPQCYARGLMKEALRQLAGLERRKRALDMLGKAIEEGMGNRNGGDNTTAGVKEEDDAKQPDDKRKVEEGESAEVSASVSTSNKRKRDDDEGIEPTVKKERTE